MCEQTIPKQKHPSTSLLSPGAVPWPGGQAAVPRTRSPGGGAGTAGQSRSAARRSPPHATRGGDKVHAPAWQGAPPLPPAPRETSTHYPCCSALRIEAQLAARAAHLPAPAAPRSAPRPSSATPGRRRHHRAGQVRPGPGGKAGPCLRRLSCVRAQRSDSGRYCSSCNWHKQPAIT